MAFSLLTTIALGTGQTGLTLSAQLVDTNGANVGSAVTTGFTEIGNGNYIWSYDNYPDGFRGAVVFTSSGDVMAVSDVNQPELSATGIENIEIEDGVNLRQAIAIISAVLAGAVTGANSGTISFRAIGHSDLIRLTAVVDGKGNRESIDLELPT